MELFLFFCLFVFLLFFFFGGGVLGGGRGGLRVFVCMRVCEGEGGG